MSSRGKEARKEAQNDMVPTSSSEQMRSDTMLSRPSGAIKWTWAPEMPGVVKISELTLITGFYCLEDLMYT